MKFFVVNLILIFFELSIREISAQDENETTTATTLTTTATTLTTTGPTTVTTVLPTQTADDLLAKARVMVTKAKKDVQELRLRATNIENAEHNVSLLITEMSGLDPNIVVDYFRLEELKLVLPVEEKSLDDVLKKYGLP